MDTLQLPLEPPKPRARDGKNLRALSPEAWNELNRASRVFGYRNVPQFMEGFTTHVTPLITSPIDFEVLRDRLHVLGESRFRATLRVPQTDDMAQSRVFTMSDARWEELQRVSLCLGFPNRTAFLEAFTKQVTPHFQSLSSLRDVAELALELNAA